MAHLDQNSCWRETSPKPTQNINGMFFDIRKSRVEEIHKMSSSIQPHTIPSCLPYGILGSVWIDGFLNQMMKRPSVGFDQSRAADVEAKEKLKYQTLLKEYLELQKEFVSRKRKLQAAKQKRELSLAEVRFLKQKHKRLSKSQAPNADKDLLHLPNMDSQTSTIDQLLLSNSHPKDEVGEGGDHVGPRKKVKNHVTQDKGEGKGKIYWPDQVTLNV